MTMIATQGRRVTRLLGLGADDQAVAAPVDPPSDEVGAIDSVGYLLPDGTRVSVYEFDGWEEADAAETALRAGATARQATSINGLLVLLATVPDDGDAGRLAKVVSRFAGRE
jgi:hypothetical protein